MHTENFEYHFVGVGKSFRGKSVIHDARIKVKNTQCTLLIGENGSGKTTLLKLLSGLDKPDTGYIRINNFDNKWAQAKPVLLKEFMYLHQQPYMFDGTVHKNLSYLLNKHQPELLIEDAIEWAGLQDIIQHDANSLSGGEKQRVAIARAYLRNPQVVLLDEPTANLDQRSRLRTLELLKQFKQQGIAMVIASHDPDIFMGIEDERLQLSNGKLTNLKPANKRSGVTHISKYKARSA
jgi:tungstate transport system ATP-binding protein